MAGPLCQDVTLPCSSWCLYVLVYSLDNYISAVVQDREYWSFYSCFLPLLRRVF